MSDKDTSIVKDVADLCSLDFDSACLAVEASRLRVFPGFWFLDAADTDELVLQVVDEDYFDVDHLAYMLDLLAGFDFATNQFNQSDDDDDVVSQNHQSDDDSSYVYSVDEDEEAKERMRPPREDGKTISSYDSSKDRIQRG